MLNMSLIESFPRRTLLASPTGPDQPGNADNAERLQEVRGPLRALAPPGPRSLGPGTADTP